MRRQLGKIAFTAALALATISTFSCSSGNDNNEDQQPPPQNSSSSGFNTGDSSSSDYIDGGSSSSWDDTENGGYSSSSEDNSQKEVASTRIQTMTVYNLNGEITSTSESRVEYEYNPDGSWKVTAYTDSYKISVVDYYSNGNTKRWVMYQSDGSIQIEEDYDFDGNTKRLVTYINGSISSETDYDSDGTGRMISYNFIDGIKTSETQITTTIINSVRRETQRITEDYNTSGEKIRSSLITYDYDSGCYSDGNLCITTQNTWNYNAAGEETRYTTTSSGQKTTYITINSKKLTASTISTDGDGNETSRTEYEYNDKGDMTKQISYSKQTDTGILVKSSESTFTYTYITL